MRSLCTRQRWISARNEVYRERRDLCLASLRRLGLAVDTPQAAFYIWFRVPAGYDSLQFHTYILEQAHVSTTPGHIYGANGEGWLRISLVANTARLPAVGAIGG